MRFNKRPWKNDRRSRKFSHAALFGTVTTFPVTLGRPLSEPEDQGDKPRCAAYAAAVAGGYIHGQRFSPDFQAAKISQIQGFDIDTGGSDPNAAMKSQCRPGFLPYAEAHGLTSSDYHQWPALMDTHAQDYHAAGFVRVDGPGDTFTNIKSALTMAYDKKTKRGAVVQAFGRFYAEWVPSAFIPQSYAAFIGFHSWDFVDYCTFNGVQYLTAQNSYGRAAGDRGFHYFPREVINREFTLPNTSLKILKTLTPEQIALAKQETPFGRIQRAIDNLWYLISTHYYVN